MNILIINELAKSGGAEMQTMRECALLQQYGNHAVVITLDPNEKNGWVNSNHYNILRKSSTLMREAHMMFADNYVTKELQKIITEFEPDYIHINNAKEHALSIFKAVKGYKCLRTIRDYGAVCPNSQSIHANLSLCYGYRNICICTAKCFIRKKKIRNKCISLWRWACFKRRNQAQKQSIVDFACPSQMLTEYCNNFGLKTTCINNPFDFSMLGSEKKSHWSNRKIFLYYGQIVDFKGVSELIEAFAEFSKDKDDVELHLAGSLPDVYRPTFEALLKKYSQRKITYLGKLGYNDMISELQQVHTVVIPSVWIENYPNTALEAAASGCLVLGSERGGMREIIGDDRFIFNVLDKNDFVDKLNVAYGLSEHEYQEITEDNKKRVEKNNSFEMYYTRLNACLSSIK